MMVQYLVQLLKLYALSVIFVSDGSYGADSQYEACSRPRKCSHGPNISFPFYIEGLQESYCGFPGFMLHCNDHGFPVIDFAETKYVVQDIFYETRSFRVYDSATLTSNRTDCVPRIRNTTLPRPQFEYASNVTNLNLWSNCNDSWSKSLVSRQIVVCDDSRVWGLYDKDEGFGKALENCGGNLVVPVEDDGNMGVGNVVEVLRKGFVIKWTASDCSGCKESGGYCGFNDTSYVFKCFCPDGHHARTCKPGKTGSLGLILGSVLGGAVIVVTSILISLIITRTKIMKSTSNNKNIELLLKQHANLAPLRYKYLDLKKMTNSFSDKLGQGGYGSVYKAKSEDGHFLAVKILNKSKSNGEDFINEVVSNSKTSHVNIVSLLGFCLEGSKRALVYEFMPNGSLDKFIGSKSCLSETAQLGWDKLFEIAVGIARGLEYLHQGCQMQILHFDIKPHNILLDKDFQPRISDFGLAKVCPNRASITLMSGTRGTAGYIAPEVFCRNFGKVSHKSDVYSYGMMALDIVGEKDNIDQGTQNTSEKYFPHWIYKHLESNGGQRIDGNEDEWEMSKRKLTVVGLWCIQTHPKDRPSMSKVVQMLEGNLDSLPIPPNPSLSSPSRPADNDSFSMSSM